MRWPHPAHLRLGAIQVLLAIAVVSFAIWPPSGGETITTDPWMVPIIVLLAIVTLVVVPQLPWWGLDVALAATSACIAVLAFTRETGQGQLALGLLALVLTYFIMYDLPTVRAYVQVGILLIGYGTALILNSEISSVLLVIVVLMAMLLGAVVVGNLRQTDRHYRLLVDNAAEVIFHSKHGLVEWISPSVQEVIGWPRSDLVGTSIHRLWHPDDHDAAVALRDAAYAGAPGGGVFRFLTKDRDYIWVEISFKPYVDEGDRGAVASMRDVSTRVAAEQALMASEQQYRHLTEDQAARNERLAELESSRTKLFQDINHELRTPLALIQAPLRSTLRDDDAANLTANQRTDIDAALRAAETLQRLVDDLLDVAKGQSGLLTVESSPTDLVALTSQLVGMFSSRAQETDLRLTLVAPGFPPAVMIDRDVWSKVVLNLVSNALKFTARGEIAVSLFHDGEFAELRVADSGVGIAEDDLPSIFTRFQQARNNPVRGDASSGLGLAVVAELVRAAGGAISVSSTVGLGSTFTVRLPSTRTTATPVPLSAPRESVVRAAATEGGRSADTPPERAGTGSEDPGGGIVALVEDHDDLRSYITRLLEGAGRTVLAFPDAESAQPRIADADLLLSDIMLPGMNGLDLVRWVRGQDELQWTPVILLTARAGRDSVVEGLGAGADDFVSKPFDPDELLARVGTHLELSVQRRRLLEHADSKAANLERALASNRTIGTALGIIMTREHVTADTAFARLREVSQTSNRKLREVADEVVYTGALGAVD